jgi:hypothetical protein
MRIVYDSGYGNSIGAPKGIQPGERSESVIVISAKPDKAEGGAKGQGLRLSGTDYELRLSPEAVARDREVRAHENAHLANLGGAAASGIIYDYATGPGGEQVAVGGRVAVKLSEVPGDPEATLRRALTVATAANAPDSPSGADMRTAAEAYRLAMKAGEEIRNRRLGVA